MSPEIDFKKKEIQKIISKAIAKGNTLERELNKMMKEGVNDDDFISHKEWLAASEEHNFFRFYEVLKELFDLYTHTINNIGKIYKGTKNSIMKRELIPFIREHIKPLLEKKKIWESKLKDAIKFIKGKSNWIARRFAIRELGAFHCAPVRDMEAIFRSGALLPIAEYGGPMVNLSVTPEIGIGGNLIFWVDGKKLKKLDDRVRWPVVLGPVKKDAWKKIYLLSKEFGIKEEVESLRKKYKIKTKVEVVQGKNIKELEKYKRDFAKVLHQYWRKINLIFKSLNESIEREVESVKDIYETEFDKFWED